MTVLCRGNRKHVLHVSDAEPREDMKVGLLECCSSKDPLVTAIALEALPFLFIRGDRDATMALVRLVSSISCFSHKTSYERQIFLCLFVMISSWLRASCFIRIKIQPVPCGFKSLS